RALHSFPTRRSSDLNLDLISAACTCHGRSEIAKAVDREQCSIFKRRSEKGAGEVAAMVFHINDTSFQLFLLNIKRCTNFLFNRRDRKSTRLNSSHVK